MEIKGIITQGQSRSLSCCESIQDILVDGKSLFDILDNYFTLDPEFDYDSGKSCFLRYVLLDERDDRDFDLLKGEVIAATIVGEHSGVCYSEYTCGYGGFDYIHAEKGHSIFAELSHSSGKYIHMKL